MEEPAAKVEFKDFVNLRTFGKNYLNDAFTASINYMPGVRLLAMPDKNNEVHLHYFDVNSPELIVHTGCVLRRSDATANQEKQENMETLALHVSFAPEASAATIIAVAWIDVVIIYLIEQQDSSNGRIFPMKIGDLKLRRKPLNLSWHPSPTARQPLLVIHDITEIIFVQISAPFVNNRCISIKKFSPCLPGSLEAVSWSQSGDDLAMCMEGKLRVYSWPTRYTDIGIQSIDLKSLSHCETKLKKRIRALKAAGQTSFVATTDTELSLLESMRFPPSNGCNSVSQCYTGATIHSINIPESEGGSFLRLIDVETAQLCHVAMPELLAIRRCCSNGGDPSGQVLAAVGSHSSPIITLYHCSSSTITHACQLTLQTNNNRPKGLAFVGSRLVVLTGIKAHQPDHSTGTSPFINRACSNSSSSNTAPYRLAMEVYNLPPTLFSPSSSSPIAHEVYSHSSLLDATSPLITEQQPQTPEQLEEEITTDTNGTFGNSNAAVAFSSSHIEEMAPNISYGMEEIPPDQTVGETQQHNPSLASFSLKEVQYIDNNKFSVDEANLPRPHSSLHSSWSSASFNAHSTSPRQTPVPEEVSENSYHLVLATQDINVETTQGKSDGYNNDEQYMTRHLSGMGAISAEPLMNNDHQQQQQQSAPSNVAFAVSSSQEVQIDHSLPFDPYHYVGQQQQQQFDPRYVNQQSDWQQQQQYYYQVASEQQQHYAPEAYQQEQHPYVVDGDAPIQEEEDTSQTNAEVVPLTSVQEQYYDDEYSNSINGKPIACNNSMNFEEITDCGI